MFHALSKGKVHWDAVQLALDPVFALAFLYLIRCSLHGAALKSNIPNLCRKVQVPVTSDDEANNSKSKPRKKTRSEIFSEMVDIEEILKAAPAGQDLKSMPELERAKPTQLSQSDILMNYGLSQIVSAFVGGWGCIPSVAASPTMFSVSWKFILASIIWKDLMLRPLI